MAALDIFRPLTATAPFGGRFSLTSLVGAVTDWNDARVTRNALAQLSARELEDIGLSYGDIDSIRGTLR